MLSGWTQQQNGGDRKKISELEENNKNYPIWTTKKLIPKYIIIKLKHKGKNLESTWIKITP